MIARRLSTLHRTSGVQENSNRLIILEDDAFPPSLSGPTRSQQGLDAFLIRNRTAYEVSPFCYSSRPGLVYPF